MKAETKMKAEAQTPAEHVFGRPIVTFLIGAAIGATVAALYTPMSGADTRARIGEAAHQVEGTAGEYIDQATSAAASAKAKGMAVVHDTLDRAAGVLQNASNHTEPAMAKGPAATA